MTDDSDHCRKVLSARLAEVHVLLADAQQRMQALSEQSDDEPDAADLQGRERRLQHLQTRCQSLQDEIIDLQEQLSRFEFSRLPD